MSPNRQEVVAKETYLDSDEETLSFELTEVNGGVTSCGAARPAILVDSCSLTPARCWQLKKS